MSTPIEKLAEKRRTTYERNPSLEGLRWGALLGVLNGIVVLVLSLALLPATAELGFALIVMNSALFTGLLVGGLCGLHNEWRGLPAARLYAKLLVAQIIFAVIVVVALAVQVLGGPA